MLDLNRLKKASPRKIVTTDEWGATGPVWRGRPVEGETILVKSKGGARWTSVVLEVMPNKTPTDSMWIARTNGRDFV